MDNIDQFYQKYVDQIYNYCFYRVGNHFIAQDLTSETFLKFMQSKWQKMTNPVAYLYAICRNLIIDHYRKHESHNLSLEDLIKQGAEFGFEIDSEQKLVLAQVLTEVNQLSEDQKEVLLLQYVQDLDNATIALTLDKSEAAVKSLAFRGLETLRKKLNQ